MARPPSAESILRNSRREKVFEPKSNVSKDMFIPNLSGDHSRGSVLATPTSDTDIANKKYVDDNIGGGGAALAVKESTVQVGGADIEVLDFGSGFDISESPDKEINISLDFSEVSGHDDFTDFVANEHLDWTASSVGTIHATNYVDNNTTDHTALSNIGTNTHTQIDTSITATGLNTTHRSSTGSDHADVASNTSASHSQSHTVASHSDTTGTGAELNELTDGSTTTLHNHTAIEGTAVLSTGEAGGDKFLREDGDGTSSWQTPSGSGDVTAAVNLTDVTIVQGDGGVKGVKTSTATVGQVASNVTHTAGDGSDHADVASNTSASHAQSHTIVSHSDTTATGAELDTLTGGADTTLHDHDGISENTTHRSSDGSNHSNVVTNTTHKSSDGSDHSIVVSNQTHAADNTQAHSDYLLNSQADVGVGLTLTADNSTGDTQYTAQVLHGTDDTPPTASGFPIGTIYIKYTA